ncbi:MAG: efflux RND transporter periplasmic adaptor subunit, partial [Oscillospiraceae bacterium]|nr:efflux RND transporter periplasmic adaptor subunit [Oscillospiraceae bacterium]
INDDSNSSDMRSSELSLKNAKLSLDDQIEKLDDYTIRSPITGTIISKTMKAGDTLDGNKSSLAIVADMSQLTFEMSVDELYIKNISVGQKVSITADALPNARFEGVVDTVSIIGTSVSGVTVYPITVVIKEYGELLPGMNVNAEIMISNAEDVLVVPQNAVSRGNLVLVKDDGKKTPPEKEKGDEDKGADDKKGMLRMPEAPEGYKYVKVTTGQANDDYVEITSGLSEGDVIYVYVLKNTEQAFAGFGGMSGGMPMGGGMPSGGMSRPGGNFSSGSGMSRPGTGGMSGGGMR